MPYLTYHSKVKHTINLSSEGILMKQIQIETLRGLACFLLVAFHVVGDTANSGLKIEEGVFREINDFLALIRMPLFTFLSGWVYALRPFSGNGLAFLKSKVRRLILPMLVVGTVFAVLQSQIPGANSKTVDWTELHLIPVAHYWFLESIFTIFLFVMLLELFKVFDSFYGFLIVLTIASILFALKINQPLFALSGTLYLFPFFLLGMLRTRYLKGERLNSILLVAGLLALFFLFGTINIDFNNIDKRSLAGLITSGACCIFLQNVGFKSAFLSAIGKFSYSIFLFHVFFTACSRILLSKLGVTNLEALFLSGVFVGIAGPIIVELVIIRSRVLRILLLGKRISLKEARPA